jgi:hypothetical protein
MTRLLRLQLREVSKNKDASSSGPAIGLRACRDLQ